MSKTLDEAVQTAREALKSDERVVAPHARRGYTIVTGSPASDGSGAFRVLSEQAWYPHAGSILPYQAPSGTPVAHVALDGTVTLLSAQRREQVLAAIAGITMDDLRALPSGPRNALEAAHGVQVTRVLALSFAQDDASPAAA